MNENSEKLLTRIYHTDSVVKSKQKGNFRKPEKQK